MNRIRLYLDGDEVKALKSEAERNLRGISEQARWWIRLAIAGELPECRPNVATSNPECQNDISSGRTSAIGQVQATAPGNAGVVK